MDAFAPATPVWDQNGCLCSPLYADVYASRQGALAQAQAVFLAGNRLAERFAALRAGEFFTIGETGFGTGLNFLAAWQWFERAAPDGARLHFMSVEKHPLAAADVRRALGVHADLEARAAALLAQWPAPLPGTHRLLFPLDNGRQVTLTLLHGGAQTMLAGADAGRGVEAWFFDGFSPSKNPAMWSAEVFAQAARLSAPGASFATWSVSGQVRGNLAAAGFAWEKMPGFGLKKEMLAGRLQVEGGRLPPPPPSALVVGAGLAGCAAARALAERGVAVTLVDAEGIGAGASGNAQGLVQPMLTVADGAEGQFTRAAFLFAIRRLAQLAPDLWHPCGALWLCATERAQGLAHRRLAKLAWPADLLREVPAPEADALAGLPLGHPAVYCALAGWVSPLQWCQRLADHRLIRVERRQVAQVRGDEASIVVVAAAGHTAEIAGLPAMRTVRVRGQLGRWPAAAGSGQLRLVLNFGHYIVPADGGVHTVGATHQLDDDAVQCRAADRAELLAAVGEVLPEVAEAWQRQAGEARAGLRCTVADRMPVIGPVPGRENLRLLTALGPRGISLSLLGAELLAAQIFGEPLPVSAALAAAVSPGRLK